jgi:hypothetical protein
MILCHSGLVKNFVAAPLDLPCCPLNRLRVDSFLPRFNEWMDYAHLEGCHYSMFLSSLTPPHEGMPLLWKPQSCLCFHISGEQSLAMSRLDSTNGSAWAPQSYLIWKVQNQMLHRQEKARWKDLLQLTDQLGCFFSNSSSTFRDISLAKT